MNEAGLEVCGAKTSAVAIPCTECLEHELREKHTRMNTLARQKIKQEEEEL